MACDQNTDTAIMAHGGVGPNVSSCSKTIKEYSRSTDSIKNTAEDTASTMGSCGSMLNGRMHIIGGSSAWNGIYSVYNAVNRHTEYNQFSRSLIKKATYSIAIVYPSTAKMSYGAIHASRGWTSGAMTSACNEYYDDNDTWISRAPNTSANFGCSCEVLDNVLTNSTGSTGDKRIFKWSSSSNVWSEQRMPFGGFITASTNQYISLKSLNVLSFLHQDPGRWYNEITRREFFIYNMFSNSAKWVIGAAYNKSGGHAVYDDDAISFGSLSVIGPSGLSTSISTNHYIYYPYLSNRLHGYSFKLS